MSFALAVGVAGLAVLGAFLLDGLSDRAESDTNHPAALRSDDASLASGWFPTDAVEHGTLLALDDDGRALVGFNSSDDLRTVEWGTSTTEEIFGERPGVAIVDQTGGVTVLAEPVPIDPECWVWARGDINGEVAAWDYVTDPDPSGEDSPQTIWVSRSGGVPVAVEPRAADGTRFELDASPSFYVTDDYLVGTTGDLDGGVALVAIEDGLATVLEPWTEGVRLPYWIHRDLCAEASGAEAYTFVLTTDAPSGTLADSLEQWTLTLEPDGTHALRQIPLVTEVEMGVPTTACGDYGANGVKLGEGMAAVGFRTQDGYELVQAGNYDNHGDVYLSPEYVVGVPYPFDGVVVTEIATGTTTTWGTGSPCTTAKLRGTYLIYPVNDETGLCRTAVVDLATAKPHDSTVDPTS
jgi:hypothetical protein